MPDSGAISERLGACHVAVLQLGYANACILTVKCILSVQVVCIGTATELLFFNAESGEQLGDAIPTSTGTKHPDVLLCCSAERD